MSMVDTARDDPQIVSVWICAVDDCKGWIDSQSAYLDSNENERAGRFRRLEDRYRFILGRTLIRQLCADWYGLSNNEIRVETTGTGRPFLASTGGIKSAALDFNLSHSGGWILLAWSACQRVGVDVEAVPRGDLRDLQSLAMNAFSSEEYAVVASGEPLQQALTFCRIWSRKEAVLKADGCGLLGDLASFSVVGLRWGEAQWFENIAYPLQGRHWLLHDIIDLPGYTASVATPMRCRLRQYNHPGASCLPVKSTAPPAYSG
jgi:phosphopantetheinyl transferase